MGARTDYTGHVWHNDTTPAIAETPLNELEAALRNTLSSLVGGVVDGPVSVASKTLRVGQSDYDVTIIALGGANSGFLIADKSDTTAHAAVLLRDQGAIRAEVGLAGDNSLRVRLATGLAGAEVFTDAFVISPAGDVGVRKAFPGYTMDVAGTVAGMGFRTIEGTADARQGIATLVAGEATVATTAVTANSRIQLTAQSLGTVVVPSALGVSARAPGTSFTIKSSVGSDTSTVAWQCCEPA